MPTALEPFTIEGDPMRIGSKLVAIGLAATLLTAGCGGNNSAGSSSDSGSSSRANQQLAEMKARAKANHQIPACTSMPKEMVGRIVGLTFVESDADNLGSEEPGVCHYRTATQTNADIPAFSVQRSDYPYERWSDYEQLPNAVVLTPEVARLLGGDAAVKIDTTTTSEEVGFELKGGDVHRVTYVVRPYPYTGQEVEATQTDIGHGIDDEALRALVKKAVEKL